MTNYMLSDQELLDGILQEDQQIISWFYDRLWAQTLRTIGHNTQVAGSLEREALRDCFSSAFLTILAKVRRGHYQPGNFWGFAYKVVFFQFKDYCRKARRHSWPEPDTFPEPTPTSTLTRCHTAAALFDQLEEPFLANWHTTISETERLLLDYRLQGYRQKEVADIVQLAPGTIRNQYAQLIKTAREVATGIAA